LIAQSLLPMALSVFRRRASALFQRDRLWHLNPLLARPIEPGPHELAAYAVPLIRKNCVRRSLDGGPDQQPARATDVISPIRAFDLGERMFAAVGIDPERGDQHQIDADVNFAHASAPSTMNRRIDPHPNRIPW
jgi:hypothetical protein